MKRLRFFSVLMFLTLGITTVQANTLHYKMMAPTTDLTIGQAITVTVSAWIEGGTGTNGLDTWQLDLDVDSSGVIAITENAGVANINLIAPDPDPTFSGWDAMSVNNPETGEVRQIAVSQNTVGAPSLTGIGGYSDVFTFEIVALAPGVVTYLLGDFGGTGFFAFTADDDYYDGTNSVFDTDLSDNVFTITAVPEPASIVLFMFAGITAALKRKKN